MGWVHKFVLAILLLLATTSAGLAAELSGWVLRGDGNAVTGAQVTLQKEGGGQTFTETTDQQGRYSFEHIPPGRYTLRSGDATLQVYVEPGFNSANLRQ